MAITTVFATQDKEAADEFLGRNAKLNLVVVKSTSTIDLWKDGEQQDPWYSQPGTGDGKEWILILATQDQVVVPKSSGS
ncbi:MAG TPA: hypothetical protein VI168_03735 [Croceibacterium sp.]